jgi:hypothetical protein
VTAHLPALVVILVPVLVKQTRLGSAQFALFGPV